MINEQLTISLGDYLEIRHVGKKSYPHNVKIRFIFVHCFFIFFYII